MKAKQEKRTIILVAVVVLTAAAIRLVNLNLLTENTLLRDFIRVVLQISLISAWGLSLYRRIVQAQARRYLCSVAVLMLLWLNFKALKYYIVTDVHAVRYLWYLYYLPLVYIPLFMLFAALCIGKAEDYRLPRHVQILQIPALLLFLMVMTNDLHQFVFRFPANALFFSDHDYQRGPGYVMVFAWFVICSFAAFALMFVRSKAYRKRKEYIPMAVFLFLSVFYILSDMISFPLTKFLAGDLSAACCLLFSAVLESCIHCGLLPVNTRYDEMFVASTGNSAQIVDEQYRVRYASQQAEPIPVEQMVAAKAGPISIAEGKILHTMPIGGGYTVWTEDVSELTRLQRELTDTKEELTERSAMLKYEYKLEKERETVDEQNRLYDLLTASTQKQIGLISKLMKDYELAGQDTEQGNAILSRIAVLGSYVKRKKHMTLSIHSGVVITEGELKSAFAESIRYLQAMNVRCALYVDTEQKFLPGQTAATAYDFFEAAVEAALNSLVSVTASVSVVFDALRVRLIVVCKEDLTVLRKEWPEAGIEGYDEDEWELILPLKGGSAK